MTGLELLILLIVLGSLAYHAFNKLNSADKAEVIPEFARFPDKYETLESVAEALQLEGLESCNLIVGIDYTASNESQGRKSNAGKSLHHINEDGSHNPYQKAIQIVGKTLAHFDEDGIIPTYGFGDLLTKDRSVFPFFEGRHCEGLGEVLDRYAVVTPTRKLSGPTSFAPIINKAIELVTESGTTQYHILLIIADGQVTNEEETIKAIQHASNYPLSIVLIGIGDGPWEVMEKFDDRIPKRRFDNFQFVDFHHVMNHSRYPEAAFALRSLMEIPQQFQAVKQLGLLGKPKTH